MRFTGELGNAPVMPDLLGALNTISDNLEDLPRQYQYMTPIYISQSKETRSIAIFNDLDLTAEEWDSLPFHIFTMMHEPDSVRPNHVLFKVRNEDWIRTREPTICYLQ